MEEMNTDQEVEIPDSPERSYASHITGANSGGKQSNLLLAEKLRNSGYMDPEYRHNRRMHVGSSRAPEHPRNSLSISSSVNLCASRNNNLFRRTMVNRNSRNEGEAQQKDKGGIMYTDVPNISSAFQIALSSGASKSIPDEVRKGNIEESGASSLNCVQNSYKGKEKAFDFTPNGSGSATDGGKCMNLFSDSQNKTVKKNLTSNFVTSPKVNGRNRLGQHGCISPHNIIRVRHPVECSRTGSGNAKDNDSGGEVSYTQHLSDVTDTFTEHDARINKRGTSLHQSTLRKHNGISSSAEDSCAANDTIKDSFWCSIGLNGRRSTHNCSREDNIVSDAYLYPTHSGRNDGLGCILDHHDEINIEQGCVGDGINEVESPTSEYQSMAQIHDRLVSQSCQIGGSSQDAEMLTKRQRKHGTTSRNFGLCSAPVPVDADIVYLSSSEKSVSAQSSRNRSLQGVSNSVIEIDDVSPVMRCCHRRDYIDHDDMDARARQIEADEMLARELQEQLFNESTVGDGEVDEQIAWMLQQEEDATSVTGRHLVSHPSLPSTRHSYSRTQSHPFWNASYRRGIQPRASIANRVAQLRNRFNRQSFERPSIGDPLDDLLEMELDMRMEILDALDLDGRSVDNQVLQLQHNFNENDYEMLLALDENNHHVGASVNQINCLPLSSVKTDNNEENCAICLESPSAGDTLRHLPCLHKFHKDCIDPWLRRKSSCPICKSSVT